MIPRLRRILTQNLNTMAELQITRGSLEEMGAKFFDTSAYVINYYDDTASEYAVVSNPEANGTILVYARFGSEWKVNPWSLRGLVACLLDKVEGVNPPTPSPATLDLKDIDVFGIVQSIHQEIWPSIEVSSKTWIPCNTVGFDNLIRGVEHHFGVSIPKDRFTSSESGVCAFGDIVNAILAKEFG